MRGRRTVDLDPDGRAPRPGCWLLDPQGEASTGPATYTAGKHQKHDFAFKTFPRTENH